MTTAVPGAYLRRLIANTERKIVHKLEVAERHEPGSQWHTRAMREAAALQVRIKLWERKLEGLDTPMPIC